MSDPFDPDAGLFATTGDDTTVDAAGPPPLLFAGVHEFVDEYLAEVWATTTHDADRTFRWCPHWAQHRVALDRLTALWQAYEVLHQPEPDRQPGLGPARWWRDHADPTLAALSHPTRGPFVRCGPGRHELPTRLSVEAATSSQ